MKRLLLIIGISLLNSAFALKLPLPPAHDDLVGQLQFGQVQPGDTVATVARRYDVGFFELAEANPEENPDKPLVGSMLVIPSQFILPPVPQKGVVINLATMRLYYFPKDKNYFYTYPVGIGKQDWNSPEGKWRITQKIKNPVWHVPLSIYNYRKQHGDPVPHDVPSGPQNPLGYFALRLSNPTYLIHGTDDPSSVGRRSSAGCIHLYPEDIKELFSMVDVNTPVRIINQPYVIGWHKGKVVLSAHLPLVEERGELSNYVADITALVNSLSINSNLINIPKAEEILQEHTGVPTKVS